MAENISREYRKDKTIKEMFFSTEGRLNRMRYFKRTLLVTVVGFVLWTLIFVIFSDGAGNTNSTGDFMINLVGIMILFPKYYLDVRRLKDIGKYFPRTKEEDCTESLIKKVAAAYAIIEFVMSIIINISDELAHHLTGVSVVIILFWLWMQFKPGTVGTNKFGEDPLTSNL